MLASNMLEVYTYLLDVSPKGRDEDRKDVAKLRKTKLQHGKPAKNSPCSLILRVFATAPTKPVLSLKDARLCETDRWWKKWGPGTLDRSSVNGG